MKAKGNGPPISTLDYMPLKDGEPQADSKGNILII